MENKITPELIEQAKKAESVEVLLALAEEKKVDLPLERAQKLFNEWHTPKELSDDELDNVAGGCGGSARKCPHCQSEDVCCNGVVSSEKGCYGDVWIDTYSYSCNSCGGEFKVKVEDPIQQ